MKPFAYTLKLKTRVPSRDAFTQHAHARLRGDIHKAIHTQQYLSVLRVALRHSLAIKDRINV